MEFRYTFEREVIRASKIETYRARKEVFDRAVAIAETLRGDKLLFNEYAALFHGIMGHHEDETDLDFNTEWELVAEAGRAAFDGCAVVDGKVVKIRKGLSKRKTTVDMPPD